MSNQQPIPDTIQELLDECNSQILEARQIIRSAEQRRGRLHQFLGQLGFTVLHEIEGLMTSETGSPQSVEKDHNVPGVSDK